MTQVGIIREIWRYPVKGMAGESLPSATLVEGAGIEGDRLWALRDTERCEIQSCKFRPELLRCNARLRPGDDCQVDITLPNGQTVGSDQDEIHEYLSTLTGRPSTLEPLRPLTDPAFYRRHKRDDHTWLKELQATFARLPGEPAPDFSNAKPEFAEYVCLPGTFFLVTPFHILTTATLEYLRTVNSEADWDVRRFRPNVVIETLPKAEGLVEQAWIGRQLQMGAAQLACTETTLRCGAVTRRQAALPENPSILRSIVRDADQNLGIYGTTAREGRLSVGDPVYLT